MKRTILAIICGLAFQPQSQARSQDANLERLPNKAELFFTFTQSLQNRAAQEANTRPVSRIQRWIDQLFQPSFNGPEDIAKTAEFVESNLRRQLEICEAVRAAHSGVEKVKCVKAIRSTSQLNQPEDHKALMDILTDKKKALNYRKAFNKPKALSQLQRLTGVIQAGVGGRIENEIIGLETATEALGAYAKFTQTIELLDQALRSQN